jgi:hypothetical protein
MKDLLQELKFCGNPRGERHIVFINLNQFIFILPVFTVLSVLGAIRYKRSSQTLLNICCVSYKIGPGKAILLFRV